MVLDVVTNNQLAQNLFSDLLPTLLYTKPNKWKIKFCVHCMTLKNQLTTVLLIPPLLTSVNTLLLSVSFKPIFVDFALVIDILALSADFILPSLCVCVCLFCVLLFSFLSQQSWVPTLIVSGFHAEKFARVTWYKCRLPSFLYNKMPIAEFFVQFF